MDSLDQQTPDRELSTRAVLARALKRARGSLLWERLWPALATLATALGLFLAFSWAGLWMVLPPLGRAIGLGVFALLTLIAALPLLWLRLPSLNDGLRRLDRASGETHRPATAVADEIAANQHDPVAQALVARACRARADVGAQAQGRLAVAETRAARSDRGARPGADLGGRDFLCRGRRAHQTRHRRLRLAGRGGAGQFPHRCLGDAAGLYRPPAGDARRSASGRSPAGDRTGRRAGRQSTCRSRHRQCAFRRRAQRRPRGRAAGPACAVAGRHRGAPLS